MSDADIQGHGGAEPDRPGIDLEAIRRTIHGMRPPRHVRHRRTLLVNQDPGVTRARDELVRLLAACYGDPDDVRRKLEERLDAGTAAAQLVRHLEMQPSRFGRFLGQGSRDVYAWLPPRERLVEALRAAAGAIDVARHRAVREVPASAPPVKAKKPRAATPFGEAD